MLPICYRPAQHHVCRFLSHHAKEVRKPNTIIPLIGLEVHIQLASGSKLFSNASYSFGCPPNTQLAAHDVAIPGTMPLLDSQSVKLGLMAALAVNAQINVTSRFDRKHYFYADSPAGYQITQYRKPLAEHGYVDYLWTWDTEEPMKPPVLDSTEVVHNKKGEAYFHSRARIRRIQLEHDTGKSIHDPSQDRSLLDFNRSGVALVELVTEPDFSNASQSTAFVRELASLMIRSGVSECNASTGQLRVDVNVSVGPTRDTQSGRVEVKNINSIRSMANAIAFEIERQISCLESEGAVVNETRSYDPIEQVTLPMRDKELIQDYRYMPEPNLPPLRLLPSCSNCHGQTSASTDIDTRHICLGCLQCVFTAHSKKSLFEFNRKRLLLDSTLTEDRVDVLIDDTILLHLFNSTLEIIDSSLDRASVVRELSFWICGKLHGMKKRDALPRLPNPNVLAEFTELNINGKLHGETAEKLLILLTDERSLCDGMTCLKIAEQHGWVHLNNKDAMHSSCMQVIADNPKFVKMFESGKRKKAIKRLVQLLLRNEEYQASQFNPFIAEQLITQMLCPDHTHNCD